MKYLKHGAEGFFAGLVVGVYCCSNGYHALALIGVSTALGLIYAAVYG